MSENFWTRRRQAVEAEKHTDEKARDEEKLDEERRALAEKPDEEVLAELDLPDPDSLSEGDDFTAFMAKAVPERLRRRALRRLWLSNPVLANLDQLVDYGEDFTDAATVVADLQTVYRVGKGMVRDEDLEPPPQAEADEAEDGRRTGGGERCRTGRNASRARGGSPRHRRGDPRRGPGGAPRGTARQAPYAVRVRGSRGRTDATARMRGSHG